MGYDDSSFNGFQVPDGGTYGGQEGESLLEGSAQGYPGEGEPPFRCPLCGRAMREMDWGWGCTGYSRDGTGCSFAISGTIAGKMIPEKTAQRIIETGDSGLIKGFTSKKGNKFDAHLKLKPDGKIGFEFEEPGALTDATGREIRCPACGSPITEHRWGWGCSGYKENGCKVSVSKEICGKKISRDIAVRALRDGDTGMLTGFTSKKGKEFKAKLVFEDGQVGLKFGD